MKNVIKYIWIGVLIIVAMVIGCKVILNGYWNNTKSAIATEMDNPKEMVINNKRIVLDIVYQDLPGQLVNVNNNSNLNVRADAIMDSEVIGKINHDCEFVLKGKLNDWFVIEYDDKLGFVSDDFVDFKTENLFLKEDITVNEKSYSKNMVLNIAFNGKDYYVIDKDNAYVVDRNLFRNVDDVKDDVKARYMNGDGVLLANYKTKYSLNDYNRNHNMELACQTINGAIVLPMEEFNWEKLIGPAGEAQGYKEAGVIYNGEYTTGYGGGICQVSTTLYNACLNAKMKITERYTHSKEVGYVPLGMDATVSYGSYNYRFVNTNGLPIVISAMASNGVIDISLYQISYE